MKTSIFKQTIHELCMDFLEFLEVSIDENPESFPCTIAYINFLCELKEKGIETNLDSIDSVLMDKVYRELSDFLKH